MILYIHCIKKYIQICVFTVFILSFFLFCKELPTLHYFLAIYNEKYSLLSIAVNNVIIFFPLLIPLFYFYSVTFFLNYIYNNTISSRLILSGKSYVILISFICFITLIFCFISLISNHYIVPSKLSENHHQLRNIQKEKPYINLQPYVFNRLNHNLFVYFDGFGENKKEIKNVIFYKTKKGKLSTIGHVKNASIDNSSNIILNNGILYNINKKGLIGEIQYLNEKTSKKEIIEMGYFSMIFSSSLDRIEFMKSVDIIKGNKNNLTDNWLSIYEFYRRVALNISILIFLFISILLFNNNLLTNQVNTFFITTILSFLFVYKELIFKLYIKNITKSALLGIGLIDIIFVMVSIVSIYFFQNIISRNNK